MRSADASGPGRSGQAGSAQADWPRQANRAAREARVGVGGL